MSTTSTTGAFWRDERARDRRVRLRDEAVHRRGDDRVAEVDPQLVEAGLRLRVLRACEIELRRRRPGSVDSLSSSVCCGSSCRSNRLRERSTLVFASVAGRLRAGGWSPPTLPAAASACLTCSWMSKSSILAIRWPRLTRSPSLTVTLCSRPAARGATDDRRLANQVADDGDLARDGRLARGRQLHGHRRAATGRRHGRRPPPPPPPPPPPAALAGRRAAAAVSGRPCAAWRRAEHAGVKRHACDSRDDDDCDDDLFHELAKRTTSSRDARCPLPAPNDAGCSRYRRDGRDRGAAAGRRRLLHALEIDERSAVVEQRAQFGVLRVAQIALRLHDEEVRRQAHFEPALFGARAASRPARAPRWRPRSASGCSRPAARRW